MSNIPDEIIIGKHVNGRGVEFTFHYVPMEGRADNGQVTIRKMYDADPTKREQAVIEMTEMGFMMLLIDAAKQSGRLRFCLRKIMAESEPVGG